MNATAESILFVKEGGPVIGGWGKDSERSPVRPGTYPPTANLSGGRNNLSEKKGAMLSRYRRKLHKKREHRGEKTNHLGRNRYQTNTMGY